MDKLAIAAGGLYSRQMATTPTARILCSPGIARRSGAVPFLAGALISVATWVSARTSSFPCADSLLVLRDRFWDGLRSRCGDQAVLNGHESHRLPHTLSVSSPGRPGEGILDQLNGIAASTGSACHVGAPSLSPMLTAMGLSPDVGLGTIRYSLGRGTRASDIDEVVRELECVV